jgi:protein gp37
MKNAKIEWTDHTFNPWIDCQHVSPGCDHCYAEAQNAFRKWNGGTWGPHATRKRTSEENWKNPIKWNAGARAFKPEHGRRPRVFCASLAGVFDKQAESTWRHDLFPLIRECRRLDWLLLTKRPQDIARMLPADWGGGYRNVWLGVTAENQTYFDQRWKHLQNIPAIIKFISYEPALGPLRLPKDGPVPDWLISGGESGGGARPLNPQWVRDIIKDCQNRGVALLRHYTNSGEPTTVIRSSCSRAWPSKRRSARTHLGREEAWLTGSWSASSRCVYVEGKAS